MTKNSNIIKKFSHIYCTNINKCFLPATLIILFMFNSCVTPSNVRNKKVYGYKHNQDISTNMSEDNNLDESDLAEKEIKFKDLISQAKKEDRKSKRKSVKNTSNPEDILSEHIEKSDNTNKLSSLSSQLEKLQSNQNKVNNNINIIESDISIIKNSLSEIKNMLSKTNTSQTSAVTGPVSDAKLEESDKKSNDRGNKFIIQSEESIENDDSSDNSDNKKYDYKDENGDKANNKLDYKKQYNQEVGNVLTHKTSYQDEKNLDKEKENKKESNLKSYQSKIKLSPKEQKTLDDAIVNARSKNFHKAIVKLLILENKKLDEYSKSNVKFWLGESHYGLKQYKKAVNYFLQVLQSPNTEIHDDSELKIANAFIKSGKPNDAKSHYQKLLADYPRSEYVPKARKMLQQL